MEFKVKIKDKQGKQLNATIKADSLAEAHEKAIKKGFEVVHEVNEDLKDTADAIKVPVRKEVESIDNQIEKNTAEAEQSEVIPKERERRSRNNRRGGDKEKVLNKKVSKDPSLNKTPKWSIFCICMTFCPLLLGLIFTICDFLEFRPKIYIKFFLIAFCAILIGSTICNVMVFFNRINYSKRKIVWFASLFLMLNLFVTYRAIMITNFILSEIKVEEEFRKEIFNVSPRTMGGKELDLLYKPILIDGKIYMHYTKATDNYNSGPFIKNNKGEFIYSHEVGLERLFKKDKDWYYEVLGKPGEPVLINWVPCKVLNGEILDKH